MSDDAVVWRERAERAEGELARAAEEVAVFRGIAKRSAEDDERRFAMILGGLAEIKAKVQALLAENARLKASEATWQECAADRETDLAVERAKVRVLREALETQAKRMDEFAQWQLSGRSGPSAMHMMAVASVFRDALEATK